MAPTNPPFKSSASASFSPRWSRSQFQPCTRHLVSLPPRPHSSYSHHIPTSFKLQKSRRRDSFMASLRRKLSSKRPTIPGRKPPPLLLTPGKEIDSPGLGTPWNLVDGSGTTMPSIAGNFFKRAVVKRQKSTVLPTRPCSLDSAASDSIRTSPSASIAFFRQSPESSSSSIIPAPDIDMDTREAKGLFCESEYFVNRNDEKFHPYSEGEAPYMQPYTAISLENDRMTNALLRRLTPKGSPSFHDFGNKPPARVLDLACGEGHWVIDAAVTWRARGVKVTGLDLVDINSKEWDDLDRAITDNITWVRHNFVHYALPFPSNSFDFIRLANAYLCVPVHRWSFVMTEIRRVLASNGIMEVVDDQMFFPSIQPPSPVEPTFPVTSTNPAKPTALETIFHMDDDEPKLKSNNVSSRASSDNKDSQKPWSKEMQNCDEVESIFSRMLTSKYKIHPRPAEFLPALLSSVFGKPHVIKVPPIHVCLPSREFIKRDLARRKRTESESWASWPLITIEWDKKDSKDKNGSLRSKGKVDLFGLDSDSEDDATNKNADVPATSSKKAALQPAETQPSSPPPTPAPHQPKGMVVFPSTFIPMSPMEVEIHTCKHLHTLLSCHFAIEDFAAEFFDEEGRPLVDPQEMEDALWDYSMFRRRRFNWPLDPPELRFPIEDTPPDPGPSHKVLQRGLKHERSSSASSVNGVFTVNPSASSDGLTFVRCFRVFEATKSPSFI
ncbi:hypothetical protein EW146_g7760 [Bondarzewia mesenterica]|uniref:Methyltransferase domain-containing protein n=1 Tax=Bondarzewia mesenterica TaxID=1095465 RepID=A0A4S4LQA6_9AGAM|nr:hypothetical protein EW146_g7760 [Bondarzewia mesenterica]